MADEQKKTPGPGGSGYGFATSFHATAPEQWSAIAQANASAYLTAIGLTGDDLGRIATELWTDMAALSLRGRTLMQRGVKLADMFEKVFCEDVASATGGLLRPCQSISSEKDLHCETDDELSAEVKTARMTWGISANKSYVLGGKDERSRKDREAMYICVEMTTLDDIANKRIPKARRERGDGIERVYVGFLAPEDWNVPQSDGVQICSLKAESRAKLHVVWARA